ncbi:hypothetical protein [Rhodopila sp.]|jgi:hypothetical protein|uniref:hypothetical protein n=1 Tax=Rhodopila sp. TaxID=2480087 RepID=UPI002CD69F88|nr:hypothetical protein [Rhodopila sp.]HVZ09905.1 hypothetical protein [Rhodopila sp.]
MPRPVQFPPEIEPLVQFIEETPRGEIVDATLRKLRDGVPARTMLMASALAVTRSSDLPPGHHGGPLHPLAGLYAVTKLAERMEGEDRLLPVVQHVALANKHIHDPVTGPFQLLEYAPLDAASAQFSRTADLAADGSGEVVTEAGIDATKAAFLNACSRGESHRADHLFLWLWQNIPAIEAFDLLLSVANPKNALDDHYFIFPAQLWRALEIYGHEHLAVLMRPAVRYVARMPTLRAVPEIDALIEQYGLLQRVLRQRSGADETAAIGAAGEAIGAVDRYDQIPRILAQALADGLSLEGAGEALSIGAAGLFLRSQTGNPMDVHLHTSANLRRYLLRLDGLSLRNKLLCLLLWHTGPEVKSTQYRMMPAPQPDMAAVAALPHRSQDELLKAITWSIHHQPATDWSQVTNLGKMMAVPEVREAVNLAQQYVTLGYSPDVLIRRLGEIVCHDNFTEMHAFKHHQAIVEEFHATREPWRWMHLVCGVQAAAISFGKNMEVYEAALDLMHAA